MINIELKKKWMEAMEYRLFVEKTFASPDAEQRGLIEESRHAEQAAYRELVEQATLFGFPEHEMTVQPQHQQFDEESVKRLYQKEADKLKRRVRLRRTDTEKVVYLEPAGAGPHIGFV